MKRQEDDIFTYLVSFASSSLGRAWKIKAEKNRFLWPVVVIGNFVLREIQTRSESLFIYWLRGEHASFPGRIYTHPQSFRHIGHLNAIRIGVNKVIVKIVRGKGWYGNHPPTFNSLSKVGSVKSLPYKMVRLDTFALVEISVKERKNFLFVNRVRRRYMVLLRLKTIRRFLF